MGNIRAMRGIALGMMFAGAMHAAEVKEGSPNLDSLRADAGTVVVKQGEVDVTLGDVDTWMLDVPEKDREGFIRSPERIEQMLFQILLMKQANADARKAKLDQKPLVDRHMKMAAERTLARYQMEAVRNAIKSPDFTDLAAERYTANPEKYREPDIATLVHVLITEGERGSDAAKTLIDKLYKQALKNPAKMEEIAVKNSDDSSVVTNQGQLKEISLATLDLEFAKAARALQPGQVSAPVKSQFGWHIIRLDAIKRGRLPTYAELKDTIKADLEKEYVDNSFREYVNGLRQRELTPSPDVLGKLPFRYGGTPEAPATPAPAALVPPSK